MRFAMLLVLAACGTRPSEPAAAPAVSAGQPAAFAAQPPINPAMCKRLTAAHHEHCGRDLQHMLDYCMAMARLTEAASCAAPAQRAFECAEKVIDSCSDGDCCDRRAAECDEIDLPFDHCLLGYCSAQKGHPDCAWIAPAAEPAGSAGAARGPGD